MENAMGNVLDVKSPASPATFRPWPRFWLAGSPGRGPGSLVVGSQKLLAGSRSFRGSARNLRPENGNLAETGRPRKPRPFKLF